MTSQIVVLVDMDCFYCQVEARLNPALQGKPVAVVQYNQWMGGGIIAVNYEARKFGVTRGLRGAEAKKKCPEIQLVSVPTERGKADLTKYREAGREVVDVLCQFSNCVERASIDEAYLDITESVAKKMLTVDKVNPEQLPTTHIIGCGNNSSNDEEERQNGVNAWLNSIYREGTADPAEVKMAIAALLVEEIRAAVYKNTGFRCSAGIAHNKILSKLACGLHKPNRQTILTQTGVTELYKTLPIKKVRSMGGKFGDTVVEQLGCKVMADLLQFSEKQLQQKFDEKAGTWLYNIARGIDNEPVTPRLISKSIGCCKKFPGKQALATKSEIQKWMLELASEVAERAAKDLSDNKRRATLLTASYSQRGECRSRSGPLTSYEPERLAASAVELIKKSNSGDGEAWFPPLQFLGISIGKFVDEDSHKNSTIQNFFKPVVQELDSLNESKNSSIQNSNADRMKPDVNNKSKHELESIPGTSNQFQEVELTPDDINLKSLELAHNETDDAFISLDELFPDLENVDENIIPHLPKKLQEEFSKRLNKVKGDTKECPVCHEHVALPLLSKHMIMHSAPNECDDSRKCHICDQHFPIDKIAEHISTHSTKIVKEASVEPIRHRKRHVFGSKLVGCPVCAKHFPGNQIDQHILSHSCQEEQTDKRKLETVSKENNTCPVPEEGTKDVASHSNSYKVTTVDVHSSKDVNSVSVSNEVCKCAKCEQYISISEYQEHLDFHTAQELDKELNQVVVQRAPPSMTAPPAKKKRGRPSKKPVTPANKNLQCITAFFTPK